jgi:hypothetical protein
MNDRLAWRIAVRDSSLDASAKLVAFTIDTYMDRRGIAWPSRQSLAAGTSLGVRTIDRALVRLEQAELIVVARGRGRRSNLYCANHPNGATDDTITGGPTVPTATPTVPLTTRSGVTSDTRSRKNLSVEAVPDRSRDQDHINFNTDVDPAVLRLAYGWIADHRMR